MDSIVLEVARAFSEDVLSIEYITTCRNVIYKAICNSWCFVVRLIDQQMRTKEQIECELQFQKFLYDNNANVTKPLMTIDSEWVIKCIIGTKQYYASAFTFAEGLNWDERVDESPETLYQSCQKIIQNQPLKDVHGMNNTNLSRHLNFLKNTAKNYVLLFMSFVTR